MKKLIMTLACAMMCAAGSAQITIKLSEEKGDTARIMVLDSTFRGILRTDTVVRKNGVFKYDFKDKTAHIANISIRNGASASFSRIFLVPGDKGVLSGKLLGSDAKWSGKGFYGDVAKFDAAVEPVGKELSALLEDYQQKLKAGASKDSLGAVVMPKYNALQEKLDSVRTEFIKANPKSGACAAVLYEMHNPEKGIGYIDSSLRTGKYAGLVNYIQSGIDAENARKEAAKNVADGAVAPDFTLKDINGTDLTLSSLRGKYLILDFWGSWCGWCIKGIPEMKNYYTKYAGKFEILGIDCNDTEDKWKAAVQKYEIPWKHVYNPKSSDLTKKYAIQGYPTKIVIDPDGKIARTIVGEDPAFYKYLDELFGAK